jgi:hypothetical protein
VLRQGPFPRLLHGLLEYVVGVVLIVAPFALAFVSSAATAVSIVLGLVVLVMAAVSQGPTGIVKQVPVTVHVVLDFMLAAALIAAPFVFGFQDETSPTALFIALGVVHMLLTIGTRFTPMEEAPAPEGAGGTGGRASPAASREGARRSSGAAPPRRGKTGVDPPPGEDRPSGAGAPTAARYPPREDKS